MGDRYSPLSSDSSSDFGSVAATRSFSTLYPLCLRLEPLTSVSQSSDLLTGPCPPLRGGSRSQLIRKRHAGAGPASPLQPPLRSRAAPPRRSLLLGGRCLVGPGSGFGSRGSAEEVSESCARADGEELEGGGEERGAGMMQCLATSVCARKRRGLRGWWEVREVGGRGEKAGHQLPAPNGPNGYQPCLPHRLTKETSLYLAYLRSYCSAPLASAPVLSPP